MSERRIRGRRREDKTGVLPFFVHVSAFQDLIRSDPKSSWKSQYRRARKEGNRWMTPKSIIERYPLRDMPSEIGSFEGCRFITSGSF